MQKSLGNRNQQLGELELTQSDVSGVNIGLGVARESFTGVLRPSQEQIIGGVSCHFAFRSPESRIVRMKL
jgi:hypothetical protein